MHGGPAGDTSSSASGWCNTAIDWIWSEGVMPIGSSVGVY